MSRLRSCAVRAGEIEFWTLSTLDRLLEGGPVEDARVELKRQFDDKPERATRQLAGHANAARGDSLLWVIGASEHPPEVVGVQLEELATWWPQVESFFDEIAPSPTPLIVPHSGVSVVAIHFEVDRAPFVVKSSSGDRLETPWRAANGTRSARRSDLVRLLQPAARLPVVEVLMASVVVVERERPGEPSTAEWRWHLEMDLYVDLSNGQPIFVADHRCAARLTFPSRSDWALDLTGLALHPIRQSFGPDSGRAAIERKHFQLAIGSPGRVELQGFSGAPADWGQLQFGPVDVMRAEARFRPAGAARDVAVTVDLSLDLSLDKSSDQIAKWRLEQKPNSWTDWEG
jgi:hypothetical protein